MLAQPQNAHDRFRSDGEGSVLARHELRRQNRLTGLRAFSPARTENTRQIQCGRWRHKIMPINYRPPVKRSLWQKCPENWIRCRRKGVRTWQQSSERSQGSDRCQSERRTKSPERHLSPTSSAASRHQFALSQILFTKWWVTTVNYHSNRRVLSRFPPLTTAPF